MSKKINNSDLGYSLASGLIFAMGLLALLTTVFVLLIYTRLNSTGNLAVIRFYVSPTLTASPTATTTITPTPSPTPTWPPTPTITPTPFPQQLQLKGLTHQWQKWNNCGPATLTMQLSHFGYTQTQIEAAPILKPNPDDKNVSPHELATYAQSLGLTVQVRQGGTVELLKTFLNNNLPILLETWFSHNNDEMGHYRLVVGYDEVSQEVITFDSYNGANVRISYETLQKNWRVFNYLYLVIYRPEQSNLVAAIIGADLADTAMYQRLVDQAEADLKVNNADAIAYFNEGDALTRLGDFGAAVLAFDQARALGLHWRRFWYQFTPLEAYYAVGRYQEVIDLSTAVLKSTGGHEESYYYLGLALQATGQPGATEQFRAALAYNPNFRPAIKNTQTVSRD